MAYNLQRAIADKIPEKDIADFLSKKHGYPIGKARKGGVSNSEIIEHLMSKEVKLLREETGAQASPDELKSMTNELPDGGMDPEVMQGIIPAPLADPFSQTIGKVGVAAREELPIAGIVAGGMAGVPIALATGNPMAVPALAGMFGAGGEGLRQILGGGEPTSKEAIRKINEKAGLGIMGEGFGPLAVKLGKRLFTPWADELAAKGWTIAEDLAGEGMSLSPVAYTKAGLAKGAQWLAEWVPSGRVWMNHKRSQLLDGLVRMREDLLTGFPKTDRTGAGVTLHEGTKKAGQFMKETSNKAYQALRAEAGGDSAIVEVPKTLALIKAHINEPGRFGGVKSIEKHVVRARKLFDKNNGITVRDINQFETNLWKADKTPGKRYYREYSKSLEDDWGAWDALKGTKVLEMKGKATIEGTAKWASAMNIAFRENPLITGIVGRRGQNNPYFVIRNAFQAGNTGDIAILREALINSGQKEAWEIARTSFVQNILDDSVNLVDGQHLLNAPKFLETFKLYEGQIQNVMPDLYPRLKLFANAVDAAQYDLSRHIPSVAGKMALAGSAVTSAAAAIFKPIIAVPVGFGFLVAKSIMNPSGLMKKWFTAGFQGAPPALGLATKIGIGGAGELSSKPPKLQ